MVDLASKLNETSDDPHEVRKALDDATSMARNLWLAFISFGTYLVIAVGSVSHRDLFLGSPISLPLLNVELPLVSFFVVAPLIFVIFHIYLLLNLKLLADNVERYNELVKQAELEGETDDRLRQLLPNFAFVQLTAGPSRMREGQGWTGILLNVIVWLTVVVGPVVLLLLTQIKFLPYHETTVTWWHRILLICDLAALWYFWPHLKLSPGRFGFTRGSVAGLVLIFAITIFAVSIATFPGERHHRNMFAETHWVPTWQLEKNAPGVGPDRSRTLILESPYGLFFSGEVSKVKGRRNSWFDNTLVLPDGDFVEDDAALDKAQHSISLRGRDLSGAVLIGADLRKAEFTGADLQDADLFRADLRKADFSDAKLRRADLRGALLQEATLVGAQLQEAKLGSANLGGAQLADAIFDAATLTRAILTGVKAIGTKGTRFRAATLDDADFRGAALQGVQFQGAMLSEAKFSGALIKGADFSGTGLSGIKLDSASLDGARLWRTHPSGITLCSAYGRPTYVSSAPSAKVQDMMIRRIMEESSLALSEEGKQKILVALSELLPSHSYWSVTAERSAKDRWNEELGRACKNVKGETILKQDVIIKIACSATSNVYVLRGLIGNGILDDLEPPEISAVTAEILDNEKCPVGGQLTDRDRRELRKLSLGY